MRVILIIAVIALGILAPPDMSAQNFDYHLEESPAISWNTPVVFDARSLSLGSNSLLAAGGFAGALNPALVDPNRGWHIAVTGHFRRYEVFQYWGINEGVLVAPDPLFDENWGVSGAALSWRGRDFSFSTGFVSCGLPSRPDFSYEGYNFTYSGLFSGNENRYYVSFAWHASERLALGLALDHDSRNREVILNERIYYTPVWYSDVGQRESHAMKGWRIRAGARYSAGPRWDFAARFHVPLTGHADRTITRSFSSNFPAPDISDTQVGEDPVDQPFEIALAASFFPLRASAGPQKRRLGVAVEALLTAWTDYQYQYFGEPQTRDFTNTVVMAIGMEYGVLAPSFDYFLRAGYRFDPQPVRVPETTLHHFGAGVGVRWRSLRLDLGASYISGRPGGVELSHFIFSVTTRVWIKGGAE